MQCILLDPYANAFNENGDGQCWDHDKTDMKPELWERKYEIDSLCYPVQLSYLLWKNTGCTEQFTGEWLEAAKTVIRVFRTEQDHENASPYTLKEKLQFYRYPLKGRKRCAGKKQCRTDLVRFPSE